MGRFVTEMDLGQSDSVTSLQQKFLDLKRDRNAVVLAHNYQPKEIQEVSDYVGDSLGLSYEAQKAQGECILFCGVHFMAETADILANRPEKLKERGGQRVAVVLPDMAAGCSMADMAAIRQVESAWSQLSEVIDTQELTPVTYINSAASSPR